MATLSSYPLFTIAQAMAYLNVPSSDQLIDLSNGVFNRIEDHLQRKIMSRDYSEIYDYPDNGELCLKQPDVTAVGFLSNSTDQVFTATYTGADTHARIEVTDTAVKTLSRSGATDTSNPLLFTTYVSTSTLAAAAPVGWTFASLLTVPIRYLVRAGSQNAKSRIVTLEAWEEFDCSYQTDYSTGILRFDCLGSGWWNRGGGLAIRQQCRIDYTAGYSTVPDNVMMTALEVLAEAWGRIGRDPSLQHEALGDYDYTVAIPQIDSKQRWLDLLSPYRRVLV